MSFELKEFNLADICDDISYGYTASANDACVGPKFLRITDIQGGVCNWDNVPYCEIDSRVKEKYKLNIGDIVIARTGNSTGENYIIQNDIDSVFASYLIRYRINKKLANPYFVWLYLRTKKWWAYVAGAKTGSAQAGANAKILGQFKLSLPPLDKQEIIASFFKGLNTKAQINSNICGILDQMAQALFKSWFVDFEPVKAKIAALDAGGSQKEAMLAAMSVISGKDANALAVLEQEHPTKYDELRATAELFPAAMQESELGNIPIDWTYTDLSSLALLNRSSWSKKNAPDSLNYVDLANTKWGIIHSIEQYLFVDAPSRARRILKAGDTIVGTVRPGNGSYAFIAENNLTGSTGFAVLTPKESQFSTFIYICATSADNIERLAHLADGGAYPAVNSDVVLATPCIIPTDYNVSKKLISVFHHYTKCLFDHKQNILLQNKTLEEIRDVLLPNILSGKIDLSNLITSSNIITEEV
ncbi:restriction endonuclease subunit S [Klebsiella quasipneumoniae]|uniref:restriction endonuclease subunit S n=1 Tax=Klebsiella quasipneumoniae TaxID=1463165 RepID=UPI00218109AB|nr:restriction endonuclease subunit S [Klebsiella quasipneumoniae]GKP12844.1 putative type-1 restriction enzyme HindVIIP specificity protein [Klebsiella quasipneumoniae]HCI9118932.1 restriction endonuclease subunit S [Klebsiella quasipneumoniae]